MTSRAGLVILVSLTGHVAHEGGAALDLPVINIAGSIEACDRPADLVEPRASGLESGEEACRASGRRVRRSKPEDEMGASGWSYFTPYQTNPNDALRALRGQVFADGGYFLRDPQRGRPGSVQELQKRNGEDGTHSILDMSECLLPGGARGSSMMASFGKLIPLQPGELEDLFGTDKPTRALVERESSTGRLRGRKRNVGSYVTVYDVEGAPHEYFFFGYSGD